MYNSNLPIKYIVKEGRINKDYLLVVFSGFSEINAERKHAYNYMTPLKNLDCNKLFILDNYGPTGCYYFGENMNLEVESSVMSLITNIIRKNKIRYENVITAGSSKGGSAALYFGLKYNFGAVFAGAFQSKIADLISFRRPEAYKYLLGEEPNPTGHQMLNNIIYKQLNKEIFTKLYLISSKKDWQHPEHIQPFLNTLEEKQIPYLYYECEEMVDHSDIGRHFPDFLIKHLLNIFYSVKLNAIETDIVNKETISGKIESIYDSRDIQLNLVVKEGKKELLKGIDSIEYTPTDPGFYSLIFQVTKEDKIVYEKELLKGFIGAGVYELNSVDFRAIDDEIEIKINTDTNDLTYAYYIYENGSIKEKIMYQKNNELRFPVQKSGSYQVQYFIKDKNGKISINITPRLKV